MCFLSEMLLNLFMKQNSQIRLENLEILVDEAGTAESLAEKSGLSPVYISQLRSRAIDVKTGKPRNLGTAAARKLETGMRKPVGWMDTDHDDAQIVGRPDAGISQDNLAELIAIFFEEDDKGRESILDNARAVREVRRQVRARTANN
ncbi:MAG TPA: hypothetical protein VNS29_15325 [Burkholderiaceae bacterium]|nr:hypothetical protein [Burkholderiaceae bacterium]